MEHIEVAD